MACLLCVLAIMLISFYLYRTPWHSRKIMNVYSQPTWTYWPKVICFYFLVKLRRLQSSRTDSASSSNAGYGHKSRNTIQEMETLQPLSLHPKAIDAMYFSAADSNQNFLVFAMARRPRGVFNAVLYVKFKDGDILHLPRMPDTLLFGSEDKFEAEGMTITPRIPMENWTLTYKGNLKSEKTSKVVPVKLELDWTSDRDHFDFDTDMHPWALATSFAKEKWSRKYFQDLKDAHQTHYEHMGKINGKIAIGDIIHFVKMDSLRDHSYGHKREWKLLHRYGLHMLHTENGFQLNVGIVSQPITCSYLELGYVTFPDGSIEPVSSVDFPLWQHGEDGTPPTDYAFAFVAGGEEYIVEVSVVHTPEFYIGWEWEARIVERMVTCRLNGVRGWGVAEFHYNRREGGRSEEFSAMDPKWTKELNKG